MVVMVAMMDVNHSVLYITGTKVVQYERKTKKNVIYFANRAFCLHFYTNMIVFTEKLVYFCGVKKCTL